MGYGVDAVSLTLSPDGNARALARIAGRATRTEHPLPPDERTVLDLVAVLLTGRSAALAAAHRAAAHLYISASAPPTPAKRVGAVHAPTRRHSRCQAYRR